MHRHMARRQEGCLARCARWLGLDRNPLRRRTDRLEAGIRLAMVILLAVAVPIATVAAGQRAYDMAVRRAQAQRAASHLATAVLLQQAPPRGIPDPQTSVEYTLVLARWQPPGLPARTGEVLAPAGARVGSTVQIWVNASGAVTDPSLGHADIADDVGAAVVLTCLASCLVLFGSQALARQALDRRRLRAWEAEWRATGPQWSGRHS